ncbi:MAG: metal-dependent hydrolase [Gemmatimonadota bacterium]
MTWRGHAAAGVGVGLAAAAASRGLGLAAPDDWQAAAAVFGTGLFFSLFPDLDTSSVPQRWFYRGVFAGLVYLGWRGQHEVATLVALVALLPVLDQHRGWTHGRLSPVLMPVALGGIYALWRWPQAGPATGLGAASVSGLHLALVAAAAAGWYGHLLLDGRFRLFPGDGD